MNRREFFGLGTSRLSGADPARRAAGWLRPPFAKPELEFLAACTLCDKCIEACPHDVLFKLPAGLGRLVAGTPAMDLLNRGCHLCADWPCVAACEPEALRLPNHENPEQETPPAAARLARVRIDPNACLPYLGPECGACADSCPVPGALEWPDGLRPVINGEICTGCALCREACILDPKAIGVAALMPGDERTADGA